MVEPEGEGAGRSGKQVIRVSRNGSEAGLRWRAEGVGAMWLGSEVEHGRYLHVGRRVVGRRGTVDGGMGALASALFSRPSSSPGAPLALDGGMIGWPPR